MLLIRRVLFLCGAAGLAAQFASAQSSPFPNSSSSSLFMAGKSNSNEFHLDFGGGSGSEAAPYSSSALPEASAASGSGMGAAQEKHGWKRVASHGLALDLGAGFNAPIGNDTSTGGGGPFITWGGNVTAGAGLHFSRRVSLLGEFQFIDDKLPGAFIGDFSAYGATNGNTHIISITADPVVDLFPKSTNGVYVTGGGGYYHKSTNFNAVECCDYLGYGVPVTINSFSSDQLGGNLGLGYTRRLGGVYGDGKMKLFAEARYLYIHTPPITETNGLGRTELIPVTLGVRW
jgi:hypothetical protein